MARCQDIIELYKSPDAVVKITDCLHIEADCRFHVTNQAGPGTPSFRLAVNTELPQELPCNAVQFYQVKAQGFLKCGSSSLSFFAQSKEEHPKFLFIKEVPKSGTFSIQFKFKAQSPKTNIGFKFHDGQQKNQLTLEKFSICLLDPIEIPTEDQVTLISQTDLPMVIKKSGKYQVVEDLIFEENLAIQILSSGVFLDLNHRTIRQTSKTGCAKKTVPHFGGITGTTATVAENIATEIQIYPPPTKTSPTNVSSFSIVVPAQHGSVELTQKTIDSVDYIIATYTPDQNFVGADQFTWKLNDSDQEYTVYIDVLPNHSGIVVGKPNESSCCNSEPSCPLKNITIRDGTLCNIRGVSIRIIDASIVTVENIKSIGSSGLAGFSFDNVAQSTITNCHAIGGRLCGFYVIGTSNSLTFDQCRTNDNSVGYALKNLSISAEGPRAILLQNCYSEKNQSKHTYTNAADSNGIEIIGVVDCILRNCVITNCLGQGCYVFNSGNILIISTVLRSITKIAVNVVKTKIINITDCITNNNQLGYYISNSTQIAVNKCSASISVDSGFYFTNNISLIVQDCTAFNCNIYGYRFEANTNTTVQRCTATENNTGFLIVGNNGKISIHGCAATNNTSVGFNNNYLATIFTNNYAINNNPNYNGVVVTAPVLLTANVAPTYWQNVRN